MTNPCAPVISVFLRPVSTRRRRWTHKELLADKLQFTLLSLHISDEPFLLWLVCVLADRLAHKADFAAM